MRIASEQDIFPYDYKTTCYILVYKNGKVKQVKHSKTAVKEAYLEVKKEEATLYAVWPGKWKSDLFLIDDLETLLEKFGVNKDELQPKCNECI